MNPSLLKPRSGKRSMGSKADVCPARNRRCAHFFVLFYCLLSALVLAAWRSLQRLQVTERSRAGLLFAARVLPFVASVAMTLAFVVPSFQLLEPRSITVDEGIGAMPLALGVCALLLIACGCFRVIAAHTITSRVVAGWLDGARPLGVDAVAPTVGQTLAFRSIGGAPPVTLVGSTSRGCWSRSPQLRS